MKNKFGFTLLEIITVCSVVLVMSCFGYMSISDRIEKNAVMEANTKLVTSLQNISNRAYYYGEIYEIKLNFEEKNMKIYKNQNIEIEKIELPKILEYEDINGKKIISRHTTPTGNMSKSFSIYITDKDSIYNRITVDTTSPTRTIFIRKYRPLDGITFANYKEEKYEKIVWKREE